MYIHSGQDAVLRISPPCAQLALSNSTPQSQDANAAIHSALGSVPLEALLQVARVHGATWLRAVCPLDTPTVPQSWAWATASNQLLLGRLQGDMQLRWSTALIGKLAHAHKHTHTHTHTRTHTHSACMCD